MSLTLIILLIVSGIVLIVLEVLVVPGGILGIVALGIIGYGVYGAYTSYGSTAGHITLAVTVLSVAGAIYLSLKAGVWKRITLHNTLDGKMNVIDKDLVKEGDYGIASSDLRPMGSALFGDEKVEVSSEGGIIPVNSRIQVLRIEDNKIFVTKIND